MERYPQPEKAPAYTEQTVAVYPADKNGLPYDVEIRTLHVDEPEHDPPAMSEEETLILEHEGRAVRHTFPGRIRCCPRLYAERPLHQPHRHQGNL